MLASEIIKKLQEIINEEGDLECDFPDSAYYTAIPVEVESITIQYVADGLDQPKKKVILFSLEKVNV